MTTLAVYPVIARTAIKGVVVAATSSCLFMCAIQPYTWLQHDAPVTKIHVRPFFFRLGVAAAFFPAEY